MSYTIEKRPNGAVWLNDSNSPIPKVLNPNWVPKVGRSGKTIQFIDTPNASSSYASVDFSDVSALIVNGSTISRPGTIADLIKKLSDDFFYRVSSGGATGNADNVQETNNRVYVTPEQRDFLELMRTQATSSE